MPWIADIFQIGMRGIGSARSQEVTDAKLHGSNIISAYALHEVGMNRVLESVPSGRKYYLTIDADGVDPSIMPAVMSQTPGGLTWPQLHTLVHVLTQKGTLVVVDLVEIAPLTEFCGTTITIAHRPLPYVIGAWGRNLHTI